MADNKWEDVPETELANDSGWEDVSKKDEEKASALNAFASGLAQDVTFGFSDELVGAAGAIGTALTKDTLDPEKLLQEYYKSRDIERQRLEELQEQQPTAYTAGELTGMVGSGLLTGGAGLAKGIIKGGTKALAKEGVKETVKKGTGKLLSKEGLKLAATGAAMGGTGAAGYSEVNALEQPKELLEEVGTGSALGAGFSYAIPGLAKAGKKGVEFTKTGAKEALKFASNMDSNSMDFILKNADKVRNYVDYPEVRETVTKKVQTIVDQIAPFKQKANSVLSDEKTIDKNIFLNEMKKTSQKLRTEGSKSAANQVDEMIALFSNKGSKQTAVDDAKEILGKKIRQANKLEGMDEVITREAKDKALNNLRKRIKIETEKAQKLGEQINFTDIYTKDGVYYALDATNGKMLNVPIKKTKMKPQYNEVKVDEAAGMVFARDPRTNKTIKVDIPKYPETEALLPGNKLSEKDVQTMMDVLANKAYTGLEKSTADNVKGALRQIRHDLSTFIKERKPEYKEDMDELSKRYDILEDIKVQLPIDIDTSKVQNQVNVPLKDPFHKKLQEVQVAQPGKTELVDVQNLLDEIEGIAGKAKDEADLVTKLKATGLAKKLEEEGSKFDFATKQALISGVMALTGGVGTLPALVIGAIGGLTAKPAAKSILKRSDQIRSGKLAKAVKLTGKAAEEVAPLTVGAATRAGAKVATDDNKLSNKLNSDQTIEELIQEFEASGQTGAINYSEQLKQYQDADTEQERRQIRFGLQQQPGFRKLLQEYDEVKDKKK